MSCYEDINNKRVVVTGGASGIGLATAERFVSEGAKVVVMDLNDKAIKETKNKIPELYGTIITDVSSFESVKSAFNQVDTIMGGIDVLVSNAGISIRNEILDTSPQEWRKVVETNLDGMFYCSKEAGRRMKENGKGVILMTASVNGLEGHRFYGGYNASKAGVILLARTLALELAPLVRCVAVCPGYVHTPMQVAEYTPDMMEAANAKIPLGHHAQPEDIAALFAFLASDQARHITGTAITIDGGQMAGF